VRLVGYADVFTPEHPLFNSYLAGHKKTPGRLLADVLEETGGEYEVDIVLPDRFLADVARAATEAGDSRLAAAAKVQTFRVSLEHLNGYDPNTTRIVYGVRLE
jgi:hypothetical protein